MRHRPHPGAEAEEGKWEGDRGPARRAPGGGGGEGGPVTSTRARQRRVPVGRHGCACGEETGDGCTWVGPGENERKMARGNRIVNFLIYLK
jgi:hypothetical protein